MQVRNKIAKKNDKFHIKTNLCLYLCLLLVFNLNCARRETNVWENVCSGIMNRTLLRLFSISRKSSSSSMPFYAVARGRTTGVFLTWLVE